MHDPINAAHEIAAHRDRIADIEQWLETADELLTGTSFAQAVSIAESEIMDCETAIAALSARERVAA